MARGDAARLPRRRARRRQDLRHAQRGSPARTSAAPTSSSASSRRTAGRRPPRSSATSRSSRAARSSTAAPTFEEMDVDAILARRPEVALVDELAHTNVPGSRNEKRWQDVEELLDAGHRRDLDGQHPAPRVAQRRRRADHRRRSSARRSPTRSCGAADQIELVDMTPEALRRRMAHGNIYPPEKVDAALANYFRAGNLAALRELALLWVADRVDESLAGLPRAPRHRRAVGDAGAGASSRSPARPAASDLDPARGADGARARRATCSACTCAPADGLAGPPTGPARARTAQLLAELGGAYHEVVGADVAAALVELARAENATQLVLGASRRSRWRRAHARLGDQRRHPRVRAPIDVHVISTDDDRASADRSPRRASVAASRGARRAGAQVAGLRARAASACRCSRVVLVAAARQRSALPSDLLLYLLLVVVVAAVGGACRPRSPPRSSASLLVNWFFTPPFHTFTIERRREPARAGRVPRGRRRGRARSSTLAAAAHAPTRRAARAEAETLARARRRVVLARATRCPSSSRQLRVDVRPRRRRGAPRRRSDGVDASRRRPAPAPPRRPTTAPTHALPLGDGDVLVLRRRRPQRRRPAGAATRSPRSSRVALERPASAGRGGGRGRARRGRTSCAPRCCAAVSHDLRTPLASIKASVDEPARSDDVELDADDDRASSSRPSTRRPTGSTRSSATCST